MGFYKIEWIGTKVEGVFYGIDLGNKNTIVSFYRSSMREPGSVSTVMGSEEYQIPTAISKRNGLDQWFYGKNAKTYASEGKAKEAENLLENAISNKDYNIDGVVYSARDLLALFIKNILEMSGQPYTKASVQKLVITVPNLSMEVAELCSVITGKLKIPQDRLILLDHMECFYYYALNQQPGTFLHDVLLIDADRQDIHYSFLTLDKGTKPITVNLSEGTEKLVDRRRDIAFLDVLKNLLESRQVSSVYLVGDGFDGGWMQKSMEYLLQNRRVFIGKNLYSKGACFAGNAKSEGSNWNYVYIGDNELKLNVSLKIDDGSKMQFITLLNAGENWFQSQGDCEVILMGTPEVEFWIQKPESRKANVEKLYLEGLPNREDRTTRLRINALAKSDREVSITIKDLGFGEIAPSSEKSWTHIVRLPKEE